MRTLTDTRGLPLIETWRSGIRLHENSDLTIPRLPRMHWTFKKYYNTNAFPRRVQNISAIRSMAHF